MGTLLYRYPGELVDDDLELNAADCEDNVPSKKKNNKAFDDTESEFSWSTNSAGSNFSFSSEKLIDGYQEFVMMKHKK